MTFVRKLGLSLSTLRRQALRKRISHVAKSIRNDSDYQQQWSSLKYLPNLDSALAQLDSLTGSSTLSLNQINPPPAWLLVKLCSKVNSQPDAEKASNLIITNLPNIPLERRPTVLILLVHLLSTYRVLPELERVINIFTGLPIFRQYWHYNHLLRALAIYADSPADGRHMARFVALLLNTMSDRGLTLEKRTYSLLLQNRYIPMQLAEELHQYMVRDNVVPGHAHLQSFLRIFAHQSSGKNPAAYARAIHSVDQTPPESKNTVKYLSRLVHENAQRAQFDADAEWFQFVKTGHSLRFSDSHGTTTTASAWAARLLSLSRTRSFSPENLVAFFDWSHAQSFPFRTHTTLSYTIVLRSLLLKGAYALALDIWERYRNRRLQLDLVALGTGVEVLTRAGHPVRALSLIDDFANSNANSSSRSKGVTRLHILRMSKPKRPRVPVSIVTRFMRALDTSNPSAALRVWDHMGTLYDVTPDARAFTVMLDAARHATLGGETFKGALQELGFSKFRFRWRLPFLSHDHDDEQAEMGAAVTESFYRARRRTYEQLENSLIVNEGDMWGNERACRRAHRLFIDALLASWPFLAEVRPPPTRAVRMSSHDPATAPLRDLKHFLMPPPPPADSDPKLDIDFDDESSSPPILPIHPRGAYPSFSPDDATFRAEILLVGTTGTAPTEIPLILAWMRALGLTPRTPTLAYALVFWAEMSRSSPLLERFQDGGRGGGGGAYVSFVKWLEEWVGVGNLPDEKEVGEAVRRVEAMRQGRSFQSYSGERPP